MSSSMMENIALAGGDAPSGDDELNNTDEYQSYAATTDLNRMEATKCHGNDQDAPRRGDEEEIGTGY